MAVAKEEDTLFQIGDKIQVIKLETEKYNAAFGEIRGPFLTDTKRYPVELFDADKTKLAIKPENLKRVNTDIDEKQKEAKKQKVVVCGGGNAAHVFLGLASMDPQNEVYLLSLFKTEAADFKKALIENKNKLIVERTQEKISIESQINPSNIGNDPSCLCDADIVIISLPAFAHAQYLRAVAANVGNKSCLVGVFPGASGLECDWQFIVNKSHGSQYTLLSCTTLPWAARIKEFGQSVEILGTKSLAPISVYPKYDAAIAKKLSNIIGELPVLEDYGHIISMSLGALNAIVHPSVLYGKWNPSSWDGIAVDKKPLFYQGISEKDAELLMNLSDETILIAAGVQKEGNIERLNVTQVYDIYLTAYGDQATDTSTLFGLITTNAAYNGLLHPMIEVEKEEKETEKETLYLPNFKYRYLTEDIPYGLIVIKGIALLLKKVPKTPVLDMIIKWAQKVMNKQYLIYDDSGKVTAGKDINETRAPQKYKFDSLQQLL